MKAGLTDMEDRLRAAYQAVAATTSVGAGPRNGLPAEMGPGRGCRLMPAIAAAILVVGATVVGVLKENDVDGPVTTEVATAPSTNAPTQPSTTAPAGPAPMCGAQLPRPLDLPDGHRGPERIAPSVEGQMALEWTSATGSVVARWPPDPRFREMLGYPTATPDGQPSVGSSGTSPEFERTASGSYSRTIVFSLRNVPGECRIIQIDVIDSDTARVDAGIGRLSSRGLFVSNVPLVVASEDRTVSPAVVPCAAPAGATVPPSRGGAVSAGAAYPTPTEALAAFLETASGLHRNEYLELRLPGGSIAYAKEQPMRPGSFVTVVHVAKTGSGWSVDRWEASGC